MVKLVDEVYFVKSDRMDLYFSNKETDCILYAENGISFNIHKELLAQTELLRNILSSIKYHCCGVIEIFFPCSDSDLRHIIQFLYSGKIFCETKEELLSIHDNLNKILGFPKECLFSNESTNKIGEISIIRSSYEIISPKKTASQTINTENDDNQSLSIHHLDFDNAGVNISIMI